MPPTTSACRAPSASRQVTPAGPTSVPPPCPAIVAAPAGPLDGPGEAATTVAAIGSPGFVAAPPDISPASHPKAPRSRGGEWGRGGGERGAPRGPQAAEKTP